MHQAIPGTGAGEGFPVVGVGYQGRTAAEIIERLRSARISLLVDVRLNSISRKPGLSKTALRTALAEARIDYLHLRELGNPKDNRSGFARPGPEHEIAVERFRRMLQQPAAVAALEKARTRARTERIALLCYEDDPSSCHRQVILDVLDQG